MLEQAERGAEVPETVTARPYNGAITREQFLFRETRIVARLRLGSEYDDAQITDLVFSDNLFERRSNHDIKSLVRAIFRRLDDLESEDLVDLIAHGSLEDARQTNLYAMMRTYRLVWEFMVGVVGERYRTGDLHLEQWEIRKFLEDLRDREPSVEGWSDSTLNKIRQVLSNCLIQAGILEKRSTEMVPVNIAPRLEEGIVGNGDYAALIAFNDREVLG